ncbi:DUF928-containing protein [Crocosphaera subtropica ATCC 51142]|uniref:DUF928-containing protein n=1 Tax=Crocosphaera subtropica (strain ATCC 51142 / BH68) TaxID=43989 RepID=B1X183_CROS5|nr:DUF928 domain-containing protein [Crocosphaera subtropica]ACB49724.1 DUF928-containing protein [Crocosphaera subtropica ATCC 51142]
MFDNKPIKTTTGVVTVSALMLLSFTSIGATQTERGRNNANQPEESIADSIPDRRKGGASRRPQTSQNTEDEEVVQAPQRRKPAASRNDNNQCNFNPQELVALIPENLHGKTTELSPTLYFSVPAITASTEIEFVLRGPEDELIEKQTFSGKGQAGIMSLKLPKVPHLSSANSEKTYHWYLSIICNQSDRADDVVVEGLLQPITLQSNLLQQLETATLEERIKLYQSHDLWHERLHTLAKMRRSQPQNTQLAQKLGELLESVQLDPTIGQKPLLETEMLSLSH